jgi:pyruvate dehydrogenase E2 component (dihydrolipoamide acetyltransferase)
MAFEFKLPDIGEGVVEGEIVQWLVKEGDQVKEDQPLVEVMTDKATVEIPSPVAGQVEKCIGAEGDTVDVGATLVVIGVEGQEPVSESPEKAPVGEPARKTKTKKKEAAAAKPSKAPAVLATPAVRKAAREKGIDLADVAGTGPKGRITADDLEQHAAAAGSSAQEAASVSESAETIPYRGLRRKIGTRLSQSKQTAAHYTYVEEVDVTELVQLRRKLAALEDGDRPTYLPFIMKAVVAGLRKFPLLNSRLEEGEGVIRLLDEYNIGLAIATEEGLIVPVIRDVDKKSLREITREIAALAERSREGTLEVSELQGGTFTITSLGALGGVMATPIVNYPEVAILGVHKVAQKPVVRGDQIVIREMMNLSISLDHRVVDGAVAAEFMQHVIAFLEAPGLLLLEGE